MNFQGNPVKKIGELKTSTLQSIEKIVTEKYGDKWQKRSLKIFQDLSTLKIITPTQNDRTDYRTEEELRALVEPQLKDFLMDNERIVYLDISLMPPQTQTEVHFDFAWIHVLARRIIIPLKTNRQSILSVLDESNKVQSFNLLLGEVYEFNNQLLHAAGNFGTEDRMHIIVDIIEKDIFDYLLKTEKIDKMYCGKLNVFYIDKAITNKINSKMKSVANQP